MKCALALGGALVLGATLGCALIGNTSAPSAGPGVEVSMQDRERILDLISSYSHTWDKKETERWASLFTDEAIVQVYSAGELVEETRSRKDRLAGAKQKHGEFLENAIQTRHVQTNTVLLRQPDGSVRGETVFWVSWQHKGESAPKLMHTGVYIDRFVRTETGWKFALREVRIDHE